MFIAAFVSRRLPALLFLRTRRRLLLVRVAAYVGPLLMSSEALDAQRLRLYGGTGAGHGGFFTRPGKLVAVV